jgi:putative endonuclease
MGHCEELCDEAIARRCFMYPWDCFTPFAMTGKCHCEEPCYEAIAFSQMPRYYCVYIMTNKANTVLYTGVTNDLKRRAYEHKQKLVEGFTKKYNVDKLVYFEVYEEPRAAIEREKQLKAGSRRKKIELIDRDNPKWEDMYERI